MEENRLWILRKADFLFKEVDKEACKRWTNTDMWCTIASKLDGSDILKLAATSQWFWETLMQQCVWKQAVLHKLRLYDASATIDGVAFRWFMLYARNFDGIHAYTRDPERHMNWLQPRPLGGFMFDSHMAILTADLLDNIGASGREKAEAMIQSGNFVKLTHVKRGIWIADLHEITCTCSEGCTSIMKTFDARHIELFATEEYHGGRCIFESSGNSEIEGAVAGFITTAAIFDASSMRDDATIGVFDIPSWEGKEHMVVRNGVTVKVDVGELYYHGDIFTYKYDTIKIDNEILAIRVSFEA